MTLNIISTLLAVLTVAVFFALAAFSVARGNIPGALVFVGFSVILGLALHGERTKR